MRRSASTKTPRPARGDGLAVGDHRLDGSGKVRNTPTLRRSSVRGSRLLSARAALNQFAILGVNWFHAAYSVQYTFAALVPAASLKDGIEMLAGHKIDVYATNKANLFEMSDALPGSRVLEGRWGLEHLAIAIPNDREAGFAYVRAFAEDAKSEGLVARAAARVALRGVAAE